MEENNQEDYLNRTAEEENEKDLRIDNQEAHLKSI
jgi:hypothetical protein